MALGLIDVTIEINSCHCGVTLSSLKLPQSCFLIGLVRDNQVILASAEPTIHCRDKLLGVALNPALVPTLKFVLGKTHPVYCSFDECFLKN